MPSSLFFLSILVTLGVLLSFFIVFRQVKKLAWIYTPAVRMFWIVFLFVIGLLVLLWGAYLLFIDYFSL